jgi:hypothetical protein
LSELHFYPHSAPCTVELLTEDEVRPYLNCQMFSARLLGKLMPAPGAVQAVHQVEFLVESYKRYEIIRKLIESVCNAKGVSIQDIDYEAEVGIVNEMCQLLPAKLDALLKSRR